jgi:hypothetical protein
VDKIKLKFDIIFTLVKNMEKTSRENKFQQIFKPNSYGKSEWVERKNWENTSLDWGKNGTARHGIYFGQKKFNFEVRRGKHSKIIALRTTGHNVNILHGADRPIRDDIKRALTKKGLPKAVCVHCGQTSSLVPDHKNGLYNDPRVLSKKTQTENDFQCLCNGCNLRKRSIDKKTRETGIRYGANNIPSEAIYNIDFVDGDEKLNKDDPDAMVGTYWYDVVEFKKKRLEIILNAAKQIV